MTYEYDLGESWVHTVVLESVAPVAQSVGGIELLAGQLACPPEDAGFNSATAYESALAAATAAATGDARARHALEQCREAASRGINYTPGWADGPEQCCAGSLDIYPLGFDVQEARTRLGPAWRAVRAARAEAARQQFLHDCGTSDDSAAHFASF